MQGTPYTLEITLIKRKKERKKERKRKKRNEGKKGMKKKEKKRYLDSESYVPQTSYDRERIQAKFVKISKLKGRLGGAVG